MWWSIIVLTIFSSLVSGNPISDDAVLELSVIHFNDFHARFQEISKSAGTCTNPTSCIGGFSRLYQQIQTLLAEQPDSVLLSAGDNFQGTLYYTVGKWNITQEFMNKLPLAATVLGNHEFDDGIDGIVPFLKSMTTPVICSNIDDAGEPDIQGTYKKSVVIERNGKKIGIIGVLYSETNTISSSGNLVFLPESASVNAEAERLVKEEGVFTNIVLSHVGYDIDQQIAANATGKIGLIVGGHSNTFLYTGDNPPGPDTPAGPYPTIVQSTAGKNVHIVQASAYTKYLGNIKVSYNSEGDVVASNGAPIYLDNSLPKNAEIDAALAPWTALVEAQGSVVLGSTLVTLSKSDCFSKECTLGNFITDAFVFAYTQHADNGSWTRAPIAFMNSGGIRTDIQVGNITYSDLILAQPFANTVDYGELQGVHLKALLEQAGRAFNNQRLMSELSLLQVSGIHVVYNISKPIGERVVDVKVRCQRCEIPVYEDLDLEAVYSIVVPSFLVGGGDDFTALTDNLKNLIIGQTDTDIFREYLKNRSPIFEEEQGRITVISDHKIETRGFE
ncbi:unnamed protein product [Ceutorhynchus assimilis]|uniref:5'-nucleotidase n=1 Tax=Ceutorhynchus assimilis TaxID=467358 RepID=A0A9N9QNJ5_9CUCU|nr:unnamed protein product [Ceutorhynchus assimilis]